MATKVYESVELELQDGTTVLIKSLSIKRLRKFMDIMKSMDPEASEEDNLDVLVEACSVALEAFLPDRPVEEFDDLLDVPTVWKIVEVAGGIKMADPNLLMEAVGA